MADISLIFDVAGGGTLKGESGGIISGQLQSIVNEINKTPYHIKFDADPASLNSIKDAITHALDGVGPGKDISNNISKSISSGVKDIIGSIQDLGTKGVAQVEKITGSLQDLLTVVNQLNSKEFGFSATFNNNDKTEKRISELELYQRQALETVRSINDLIGAYGRLDGSTKQQASFGTQVAKALYGWKADEETLTKGASSKSIATVQTTLDTLKKYYNEFASVMERARAINPSVEIVDSSGLDRATKAVEAFKDQVSQTKETIDQTAQTATNPFAKMLEGLQVGVGGLKTEGMEKSVGGISDLLDGLRQKIESVFDLSTINLHEGSLIERINKIGESITPISSAFANVQTTADTMSKAVEASANAVGAAVRNINNQPNFGSGTIEIPFYNELDSKEFMDAMKAIDGIDDKGIQSIASSFAGIEGSIKRIQVSFHDAEKEEQRFYQIAVDAENAIGKTLRHNIIYDPTNEKAVRTSTSATTDFKAEQTAQLRQMADAYNQLDKAMSAYYRAIGDRRKYAGDDARVVETLDAEVKARLKAYEEAQRGIKGYEQLAESTGRSAESTKNLEEELRKLSTTTARSQAKANHKAETDQIREMTEAYKNLDDTMSKYYKALSAQSSYTGDDKRVAEALQANVNATKQAYEEAQKATEKYDGQAFAADRAAESTKKLEAAQRGLNLVTAQGQERVDHKAETDQIREMTEAYNQLDKAARDWYAAQARMKQYTGDDADYKKLLADQEASARADYETAKRAAEQYGKLAEEKGRAAKSQELLNDLEENYARISQKAESSAETAEKKANNERAKAADLMQRIVAAENNWTAAKNGRSSEDYKNLTSLRLNLSSLINEYNTGSKDVNEFSREVSSLNAQFQASSVSIKAAGEDTSSLMRRFQSIGAQFGAWIGASRIVMAMVRSLKQLVSASIEVDTAMTQLRIVTNASNAELEEYGNSFARTAKQIGASITDLIDSATVFGRLGYSLSESSSLAKFTAMLKAVGDIEISDAQDAVTAITKAFSDEVHISDIESVMDRLVEVGKDLPRHTVTYVYVIGYNGQRRTGIISETVERFSITNTIYPERLSCCN